MPPLPLRALCCSLLALCCLVLPAAAQVTVCEGGTAQPEGSAIAYPCDRVDLLSRVSHEEMGDAFRGNDVWGWTDPLTGGEYALVGLQSGTAFVDVSDPVAPVYLGTLPTHTQSSTWRDIKTFGDYAYVVSEAPQHGMQVFDLTQLRGVLTPTTWAETAHYDGVGGTHNLFILEATSFAYVVGADAGADLGCDGGLHMVDLAEPESPTFAGCFSADGYTHDVQCVVYDGPDLGYQGREICVAANEDTFTIVDVTDKAGPVLVSQMIHPNHGYAHQGWLTEDHRYFIANDELDEQRFGNNTRTLVFDVADLDEPEFRDAFLHDVPAIDHNLYIVGSTVFETNDAAGLRILDASGLLAGEPGSGLAAAAFFDTHPETDAPVFEGTWSNYPFFESGIVIANDRSRGLFVLQPRLTEPTASEGVGPAGYALSAAYPNPFATRARFSLRVDRSQTVTVAVYDVLGRRVAEVFHGVLAAGAPRTFALDGNAWPAGTYLVRVTGEDFAETRRVMRAR
jgi:choice-of-anchor B domain-containing protein